MKIELHEITVRELFDGYKNNDEAGAVGYGGKLDIRPPYQREFIYKDKQRDAVIHTVRKDYPLNVMYWSVRDDGKFEVIDGQQRTISICSYVDGRFSIGGLAFHDLQDDQQAQILNYKLMVLFLRRHAKRTAWLVRDNKHREREAFPHIERRSGDCQH